VQTNTGFSANGIQATPDGRHLIVDQTWSPDGHSALYWYRPAPPG
jgi:hypothetical protein